MKKILILTVLFTGFSFSSLNANTKAEVKGKSCFSFYHGLFEEYYGGITLENVGDFNELVAQCESL